MRTWTAELKPVLLAVALFFATPIAGAAAKFESKPILDVLPKLEELGEGWTTNVVAYLVDPLSHPPEIDYRRDAPTSPLLNVQREIMKTSARTGCGMALYGRGDLIMNRGLFRVHIQRWTDTRALHNEWVGWKMDINRVLRDYPPVGEDCFWTNEWWRRTPVAKNFIFRRGLFHVVVEAGDDADCSQMLRLATALDAHIRSRSAQVRK